MDAGLPDALSLTRRVYEALDHRSAERSLFGYVIAKLIVRKSRLGLSPFQGLNVEEVYDALKRFIARDTDVLTEFVYSWDPITSPSRASFQSDQFARLIGSAFSLREGLNHIAVAPDNSRLRAAGELIHLNAIIRAWTSSKLRAKMVILDPSLPRLGHDVLGKFYTQDRRGQRKYTVEIDHIDATAAEGMDRFLKSLAKAPNPKPPAAITISPIPVR